MTFDKEKKEVKKRVKMDKKLGDVEFGKGSILCN